MFPGNIYETIGGVLIATIVRGIPHNTTVLGPSTSKDVEAVISYKDL